MILLLLLLILTLFGKASTIFHAMKTELQKILDPHSHTQFRTVLGQATIDDFIHVLLLTLRFTSEYNTWP
jgi:hypothetical protein